MLASFDDLESAKKELESAQATFQADNISCETKVMFGGRDAGEKLVESAKEKDAAEIIIGIQKRSKVGKFLFGSTAQHVILEAHCPVVTVK